VGWFVPGALVIVLSLITGSAMAASPQPTATALARTVQVEVVDGRTRDLTIDSPAVGTVHVRLLLPTDFDVQPDTTWPVLYLLHGCCDGYDSWTRETDVDLMTEDLDLLVVMSDGGRAGWYADWWNGGRGGRPMWETFHTAELPAILAADWRADTTDQAIAGLSMGGHGAMGYAARHPGTFRAAASYSGVLDLGHFSTDGDWWIWGDRDEQADNWAAHDPVQLAPELRGTDLFVSFGSGEPGPLDLANAQSDGLEASLAVGNRAFVERLLELEIPVLVDAYGPGTHTWPYWDRALQRSLPFLMDALE
jgi:S-formylglutathione hydrolase FrmB